MQWKTFVDEALSTAILDSGCTRTVCGQTWMNCYLDTLLKEESDQVVTESSETFFKFGD